MWYVNRYANGEIKCIHNLNTGGVIYVDDDYSNKIRFQYCGELEDDLFTLETIDDVETKQAYFERLAIALQAIDLFKPISREVEPIKFTPPKN